MNDESMVPGVTEWWGTFDVAVDAAVECVAGPLTLSVRRHANEWRVLQGAHAGAGAPATAHDETARRFVFRQTEGPLRITPALADRPVVTRPADHLAIAPDQELTLYVSSPVWVRLDVGEPPQFLDEMPIVRSSDTWFGPNTREGMVCYASRTEGRLSVDDIPARPDRAVTAARLRNLAGEPMTIDRISLPVPYMALYATVDGRLWTQSITLIHTSDAELSEVTFETGAPGEVSDARQIAPARQKVSEKTLFHSFSAMFG
ncbi:MAG: hypothetical protein HKO62_00820 [Gammaproteobacteria bacterium]|nr:hypothetical protein [Gammaproteobacteria bacterium]NNL99258.1 hypothetical protein [Gammaproteobacteria bacterium]